MSSIADSNQSKFCAKYLQQHQMLTFYSNRLKQTDRQTSTGKQQAEDKNNKLTENILKITTAIDSEAFQYSSSQSMEIMLYIRK